MTIEEKSRKLEQLFEELYNRVREIRKKTYDQLFLQLYHTYQDLLQELSADIDKMEEADRMAGIEEIAAVIPAYAKQKMGTLPKRSREVAEVDFNMTMAVFVIPLLTYEKDPYCGKIADRMVELWNEAKVTTLVLKKSSYDAITDGFKQRLCYITTAVCGSSGKADDCYELETLRAYRDEYLMKSESGRELVEEYYEVAPMIVMAIDMHKDASSIYRQIYQDYLMPCVHLAETGENEACKKRYTDMVYHLQHRYLHS